VRTDCAVRRLPVARGETGCADGAQQPRRRGSEQRRQRTRFHRVGGPGAAAARNPLWLRLGRSPGPAWSPR